MTVTFREPALGDETMVSIRMRPADIVECRAGGHTPYVALKEAKARSALCWTGCVDGEPEAMFGVVPGNFLLGIGYPWFLGSARARRSQRQFLEVAPEYLGRMEALFPRLEGAVWAGNTSATRWLHRMGFVVDEQIVTLNDIAMHRFHKGF